MGRREAQQQMIEMQNSFRLSVSEGRLSPNTMLPPVRELAEQFGLSHMAVARSLQTLVEEGVLRSVPRVGYFVGAPVEREAGTYLMMIGRLKDLQGVHHVQMQVGFENRISKLGGSSLVMDWQAANNAKKRGALPGLAGIFNLSTLELFDEAENVDAKYQHVPGVWFGLPKPERAAYDTVSFDDFAGGARATRHLLGLGHRRIAFLGLHTLRDGATRLRDCENDGLLWSVERHNGWTDVLHESGIEPTDLYFHPRETASSYDANQQMKAIGEGALQLIESLQKRQITAVVAVNGAACRALIEAFVTLGIEPSDQPALVSFDDEQLISSIRLPWHELGAAAANLLWERHQGTLRGAAVHRAVAMRLIPRLSCRTDWNTLALAS